MSKDDARVRKSKTSIWRALVELLNNKRYGLSIRPYVVCRLAKVSRNTFWRHYRNMDEIFEQRDIELHQEFDMLKITDVPIKIAWQRVLIFMLHEREVFLVKLQMRDDPFIREMIEKIYVRVDFGWGRYESQIMKEIFEFYYYEIFSVLKIWAQDGMPVRDLGKVVKRIDFLTRTADRRWLGVAK